MTNHEKIKSAIATVKHHCIGTPINAADFDMNRSRYSEYGRVMCCAGLAHAWAMCKDKPALLRALKDLMKLIDNEKSTN